MKPRNLKKTSEVKAKDLITLLDIPLATAQWRFTALRRYYGKQKHQPTTILDLSNYFDIPHQDIIDVLSAA